MNNDSERVLGMLSEGKITVDQAERLLEALSGNGQTPDAAPDSYHRNPASRFRG